MTTPLQHRPITFLPPAAVFETLRELGRYAKEQVENQRKEGIHTKMVYWQGATAASGKYHVKNKYLCD